MKEMHDYWCRRLSLVKAKMAGKWFGGGEEIRGRLSREGQKQWCEGFFWLSFHSDFSFLYA